MLHNGLVFVSFVAFSFYAFTRTDLQVVAKGLYSYKLHIHTS